MFPRHIDSLLTYAIAAGGALYLAAELAQSLAPHFAKLSLLVQ